MVSDDDDSDIDHIMSYCQKCQSYNFLSELGSHIYLDNQPIPSDSDVWLQCYRCGTIISKVHAKHENEITGIVDPPENIHDAQKVVITPLHAMAILQKGQLKVLKVLTIDLFTTIIIKQIGIPI